MQIEKPDETAFLKEKIMTHIALNHYERLLENIQLQEENVFTIQLDLLR